MKQFMFPGVWFIGLLQSVTETYHTCARTHRGLYCSES